MRIQDCELKDYEIQVNVKSKTLKKDGWSLSVW